MTERRPLGTGPRPASPPAQPPAARRVRLAAEGPEAPGPSSAAGSDCEHIGRGRRALGRGITTDGE
ncbi:hypothetical protein AB0C86_32980 [Streptomyces lavendulae]|uniref:hypothetical protein n=1 Tax=Streptomyces lavendulae TaxID=1914 RepID=UPI0033DC18C0